MNKDKLVSLLCILSVALCLIGVGCLVANFFLDQDFDITPIGFICIILGNLLNMARTVIQKKK